MRTIHLCIFNFKDQDIRRTGNVLDGGTSLSGLKDEIETDGGGYWQVDASNGSTRDAASGLAWREVSDIDRGEPVNVMFCEKLFQPIEPRVNPCPNQIVADDAPDKGANYVAGAAALRSTTIAVTGIAERPLKPGMIFSIRHPNWGWRTYRIRSVDGGTLTFRPPLREAVAANTSLEFDNPRCQMVLGSAPSNPTNLGRYTSCAISLVEDMRPPRT